MLGFLCFFAAITVFDGKDVTGELRSLPMDQYQIYEVPTLGSFYLDYLNDTIKKTLSQGAPWEPNIVELIHQYAREGTISIDLGSHNGMHLLSMSQAVGKTGTVIGFEPQTKLFAELVHNMQLNHCENVKVYRCAVGSHFDEVQMNVAWTTNEGGTAIGQGGDFAPLIPLDSLNLSPVSLIKIDVEGYEDKVIAGAMQTIRKNHPYIIIELMDSNEEQRTKRDATIANLEQMGYFVTKLCGWDWLAIPL
jgi:FkbM family methyltransferase